MMLLSLVGCLLNLGPPEFEVLRSLDSDRCVVVVALSPGLRGAEGGLGSRGYPKLGLPHDGVPLVEPPTSAKIEIRFNANINKSRRFL